MDDGRTQRTALVGSPAGRGDVPRPEFTRRVLVVTGVVTLAVAVGAAFARAADVFLLFFAAVLLAILLRSASDALGRWTKLGPGWSLGLALAVLVAAAAVAVYLVGTMAAAQFGQLADELPRSVEQARAHLRQYPWGDEALRRAPPIEELVGGSGGAAARLTGFFSTTLGVLGNLVVLAFLTVYLAAAPGTYVGGLVRLAPPARRARAREVISAVGAKLRWWLVGRLLAMASVGLISGVGLWLIGVPQYLVLAVVAAVLSLIPFLGSILGAVPGVLVALMQGPTAALWAVGVYTVAQAVENYVVTPLAQQRMVNLPPAVGLAAVTVVGVLFGVLGLVVAAPLAVVVMTAVQMLYVEDVLGDEVDAAGGGRSG